MIKKILSSINWKVRFKSKWFWISMIAAVLLVIEKVAAIFGLQLDLSALGASLNEAAGAILTLLALLGIPIDFTTEGYKDSAMAMTYDKPHAAADDECMMEAD